MGRYVRALSSLSRSTVLLHSDEYGHYPCPTTLWIVLVVFLFSSVGQDSSRTYLDAARRQGSEADPRRFAEICGPGKLVTAWDGERRRHTLAHSGTVAARQSNDRRPLCLPASRRFRGKLCLFFLLSRVESHGNGDTVHHGHGHCATLHPRRHGVSRWKAHRHTSGIFPSSSAHGHSTVSVTPES